MGWAGTLVVFLHIFFGSLDAVKKLNSFLKWVALVIGVIQAGTLAVIFLGGAKDAPSENIAITFFFAVVNLTAWMMVRSSERTKEHP